MNLITGCAGFIGFHLAKKLLIKKKTVIGIDSLDSYYSKDLKFMRLRILKKFKNFHFKKIDLKNFKLTHNFIKKKKN